MKKKELIDELNKYKERNKILQGFVDGLGNKVFRLERRNEELVKENIRLENKVKYFENREEKRKKKYYSPSSTSYL